MRKFFFISISFLLLPLFSEAQLSYRQNFLFHPLGNFVPADTIVPVKAPVHSPKKAALMSACLPGLGQIYNRKWWKLPFIYAGFGGLGYGFAWNQGIYKDYRNALKARYDNNPATVDPYPNYTDDNIVTLKNYYQRYRDLCVIGMAALYTLQVIDATVDAHLMTFDVSDNLSMNVAPQILYSGRTQAPGIGLRLFWR